MKKTYKYIVSILVGLIVGMATVIGQKYLSINFNFLANSGAIWLIPAYLLSYYFKVSKKNSILISIMCLIFCVLGYYGFESVLNQHAFIIGKYMIIWMVCAFLGGIIFGLGAYYANNKNSILKQFGQNLLPAVFLSEGINKLIHIKDYTHMIPAIVMVITIGVILYLIVNGRNVLQRKHILTFGMLSLFGIAFYEIIYRFT